MSYMLLYEVSPSHVISEILELGADPASLSIFSAKARIIPIKIHDVPSPAAIILKQELLNLGGDAAIHKKAITCGVDRSSVLLLGTLEDYSALVEVLKHMPYFQLDEVRRRLSEFIRSRRTRGIWELVSPWRRRLKLDRTKVMAIINLTPDSFYPASRALTPELALQRAKRAIEEGAEILDLGAVSTRPGSEAPPEDEEVRRLLPALKLIREELPDAFISVDTFRAEVARRALELGADMINDVSGLQMDENMIQVVTESHAPVVINHMRGTPKTMQDNPEYHHLVREISSFLMERVERLMDKGYKGVPVLDPGIGFGKRLRDNLEIIARLIEFKSLGYPILIGHSRKSFIGITLGGKSTPLKPEERLEGTIAVTAICALSGVHIVRVHDVKENVRAIEMVEAIKGEAGWRELP